MNGSTLDSVVANLRLCAGAAKRAALAADPLKPPRRVKCPRCNGTGQRIIHCATVERCRVCDGRKRVIEADLPILLKR